MLQACLDPICLPKTGLSSETTHAGLCTAKILPCLSCAESCAMKKTQLSASAHTNYKSNMSCAGVVQQGNESRCQCPSCCWALEVGRDVQLKCRVPLRKAAAKLDDSCEAATSSAAPAMTSIAEEVTLSQGTVTNV